METTHFEKKMAASEEVSIDIVRASVLSELERISSLKEKQTTALKGFVDGKDVFLSSLNQLQR